MYLLKFDVDGNSYFLHNGETFIGGENETQARQAIVQNTAKSISVRGFDIVKMSIRELSDSIGGVPYSITRFSGGLGIPFWGVKIKNEQ